MRSRLRSFLTTVLPIAVSLSALLGSAQYPLGMPSAHPLPPSPVPQGSSATLASQPARVTFSNETPERPSTGPTYSAVFSETGIPAGDFWSVNVECNNSSASPTPSASAYAPSNASIALSNGTCVAVGNGWGHGYPTQAATMFTVNGGPVALTVAFASTPPTVTALIFVEYGIGNGTTWGINFSGPVRNATVNGPYGDLVLFIGTPGSYNSTIFVGQGFELDGGGRTYNFTCPGPGGYSIFFLRFEAITDVTFHEVGLPPGTSWSVGIGNVYSNASMTGTIDFRIPNSPNWSFDVPASGPLLPSPSHGKFNATGAPIYIPITFGQPYTVSFEEGGLPVGTRWVVSLAGTTNTSTTTMIGFLEPNGTGYSFQVGSVPGYVATPSFGTIAVEGSPATESVTFAPSTLPLAVRAWGNQTGEGGKTKFCQAANGTVVASGPSWVIWTYSAVASNGTPPFSFTWTFPGSSGTYAGATLTRNYTWPSTYPYSVTLVVEDSSGASNTTHLSFPIPAIVRLPPCPSTPSSSLSTFLGLPQNEGYALIVGLAIAVVATTAAVLVRRTRNGGGGAQR